MTKRVNLGVAVLIFILLSHFATTIRQVDAQQVNSRAGAQRSAGELKPVLSPGLILRNATRIEIRGELNLDPTGQNPQRMPLEARGVFEFAERVIENGPRFRSLRHYERASSQLQVGGSSTESRLTMSKPFLLVEHHLQPPDGRSTRTAGLASRPRQSDIELVEVPMHSLALHHIFANADSGAEQTWTPGSDALAAALHLDQVTHHEVKCRVLRVEGSQAVVSIIGSINGVATGAPTEIRLDGQARFDTRQGRVTWYELTINEERAPSLIVPGFSVSKKIETTISDTSSVQLNDEALRRMLPGGLRFDDRLLFLSRADTLQLIHDPSWRVVASQPGAAVFRMTSSGQLIAQCNVVELQPRDPERPARLADFRADVETVVKSNGSQIVSANESRSPGGLQLLRIETQGVEEDTSITWLYYHVSDRQGRQCTLVFTMETQAFSAFGNADQRFIDGLVFLETPEQSREATGDRETASPPRR